MGPKEIWANAWKALRNDKEGFAIKKMIAAKFCLVAAIMVFVYTNDANYLAVLAQVLGFVLLVLGIRKMEKADVLKAELEKSKEEPK